MSLTREERAARLRPLLRRAVGQSNLRAVASEIGVSHGTLHNLVEKGWTPYTDTLNKMEEWAVARGISLDDLPPAEGVEPREETPEQAMAGTMPDVSFLKPRARAIYDRAVGSYLTRGWPQPILERAAWDLVNYIIGANTLRSSGPGRPELTEDEQVMVLERTTEHVERAYGPNGVIRRF